MTSLLQLSCTVLRQLTNTKGQMFKIVAFMKKIVEI